MPDPDSRPGGQVTAQAKTRINEEIRIRQVRLIDDKGNQLGVIDTSTAMDMAREKGLDLVEVAPDARPPVCKLLDFGKQKYLQKKKENEARKKQHQVVIKEVRVRPKIDTHDLDTKLRKAREFLEGGDKLQVNMLFRGREHGFRERGLNVMIDIKERLSDISKCEREPRLEGNRLVMLLQPLVSKSQVKHQADKARAAEKARKKAERHAPRDGAAAPTEEPIPDTAAEAEDSAPPAQDSSPQTSEPSTSGTKSDDA